MNTVHRARRGAVRAVLSVAVLAVSLGLGPLADAQPSGDELPAENSMQEAMQRDLNLGPAEAAATLEREAEASVTAQQLETALDADYAGAYITPGDTRLTVAVTTEAAAAEVSYAGAIPVMVERGMDALRQIQARIDAVGIESGIVSTVVDPATNVVLVRVKAGATAAAEDTIAAAAVDIDTIRVVEDTDEARMLADFRGGDAYLTDVFEDCSVGFAVTGDAFGDGFVTAGHCLNTIDSVIDLQDEETVLGTTFGSSFPPNDYALVDTNPNYTGTGTVGASGGPSVAVEGSAPAVIGAATCRVGATTGWRCGRVQALNLTQTYSPDFRSKTVFELTETSACAEGGDSGGPVVAGGQAQGVVSGARGDCTSGGVTWFQPVQEILTKYDASLVTS